MPKFQAACVGGDAQHALAGSIVDEEFRALEDAARLDELVHVLGAEMAAAKLVTIHPCLTAEQALGQLNARLLQTDKEHRAIVFHGDVPRQVQSEGSFADARPGRDNDEL